MLRLPPHNKAHATFMQPFQCDLRTQTQETHRTTYTGTSSVAKHSEGTKRPQPHPPHRRGTFHRRLQPLYTEKHKVSCSGFLPTTKPMQHSCSHSNAICEHKLKKRIELRTQEHPVLQNTLKERNDPSRTRRTDEVPFIVACSHFTRKNTRFRAPASSPQQSPCNIHAAIPMRFCKHKLKKRIELRTQEHPVLQNTLKERNDPSRTRRTDEVPFIVACSHFTRKNTRFRAPASSPQQSPCNIHAAIPNAICEHKLKKRIELRTQEHPVLQNTLKEQNDPSRTRRTDEVPFIVACSHFTRKNTRFRAPASSPKHSPCNIHAALTMRSATTALPHRFPSSPLPFIITSLLHHFPSSPLPFVTTSLLHHFPSSPLPFLNTSHRPHLPSSPLPFITTSLLHHFPSSPLPFVTTSLLHHFPSSPLPIVTTSLRHHPVS